MSTYKISESQTHSHIKHRLLYIKYIEKKLKSLKPLLNLDKLVWLYYFYSKGNVQIF